MTRRDFPVKSPGDSLSADHVNLLSDAARQASQPTPGSFQGSRYSSFGQTSYMPPNFEQFDVEVISEAVDEDLEDGIYEVRPRYYDRFEATVTERWKTDTDSGTFYLDTNDTGVSVSVGDIVTAYFSHQRNMFIPIGGGTAIEYRIVTDNDPTNSSSYHNVWVQPWIRRVWKLFPVQSPAPTFIAPDADGADTDTQNGSGGVTAPPWSIDVTQEGEWSLNTFRPPCPVPRGTLVPTWKLGGKRYFHYIPEPFYAILDADLAHDGTALCTPEPNQPVDPMDNPKIQVSVKLVPDGLKLVSGTMVLVQWMWNDQLGADGEWSWTVIASNDCPVPE